MRDGLRIYMLIFSKFIVKCVYFIFFYVYTKLSINAQRCMGRVPSSISASLLFPAFVVWLYLLHIEPSHILFCVIACLPYLAFVLGFF